ncbi:MAG: DUF72 domain-containing protein [Candidatus Omnitrophica bacterium]|nr:DUF72 domain-containing protein [Candidatus Omnitrophota bacterium]
MDIRIGCCGFPVKREEYFSKFRVMEVQKTFYSPPRVETLRRWRMEATKGFEFTLKAWQVITHEAASPTYRRLKKHPDNWKKSNYGSFKPTDEVFGAWEETEKAAAALGAGIIVFQCPPSFLPTELNKKNLRRFFRTIDRGGYTFVWEVRGDWKEEEVKALCEELDLVHCVDPFKAKIERGRIRYFRMHGIGGYRYKYTGMDLKKLRDFCESEIEKAGDRHAYVLFNNISMMHDAMRFKWIIENTGRIKEINTDFIKSLCHRIEYDEEDEKVERLSREAERIVSLILHTDYARVDIEIEKSKLRELCRQLFPDKEYLYEMIYSQRFDRLWEQFREIEKGE